MASPSALPALAGNPLTGQSLFLEIVTDCKDFCIGSKYATRSNNIKYTRYIMEVVLRFDYLLSLPEGLFWLGDALTKASFFSFTT